MHVEHMFNRAEAGYVQDQLKMARAYQLGRGVPHDPAEAAQWFLKAANFGSLEAQTQIGYLYVTGEGLPRDEQQAFKWFQRAAAEGYAPAQYDLAYLLLNGLGARQDLQGSITWFTQAANQGFAPAQVNQRRCAGARRRQSSTMRRESFCWAQCTKPELGRPRTFPKRPAGTGKQ